MELILNINKPFGITSYDVIRELKKKYKGEKIGHAGTLDPLATGVLICLVGKDATKRQSEFMNISKDYEFDILFGFETDTYDVLGLPSVIKQNKLVDFDLETLKHSVQANIAKFKGSINQKVPPFSAVKIQGKPLYRWYLQGKIDEVSIPTRTIFVDNIDVKKFRTVKKDDLSDEIRNMVNNVRKGFRKNEVWQGWVGILDNSRTQEFLIVTIKATVSKGTYIRAIAHELGQNLGIGGTIVKLTRTRVGDYKIENSLSVDSIV